VEAHRPLWSPNTVRGFATSLAQWWTFLEQRGEAGKWRDLGVPAFAGFLSWLRNGRTVEHALVEREQAPAPETLEARLAALISFYRWQEAVFSVPVAGRLMRGTPRRAPARGLLAHLDARTAPDPSSLVRVRRHRHRGRPPLLLPTEIQAILDGCAMPDASLGEWAGNLRDRLLIALLTETGMRLGEALGLRIGDFVMGRGGTPQYRDRPARGQPERGEGEDDAPPTGLCRLRPGEAVRRLPHPSRLSGRRVGRGDWYALAAAGEPDPAAAAGRPAGRNSAGQDRRPAQGLPDLISAELAWMSHWQAQEGTRSSVLGTNQFANILRRAIRENRPFPPSIRAMDWETASALQRWFYATRWGRLPPHGSIARLRVIFRFSRLALLARCSSEPWWTLDEWHPRCDPRIPLAEHEPQAHYGCSPSKISHRWLREAVKWWLGTQLEAGVLRWSTVSQERMRCLVRFDRWLSTFADPLDVLGDPAHAVQMAAAFRRWDADPGNRLLRESE
jgi:hypothetical protein